MSWEDCDCGAKMIIQNVPRPETIQWICFECGETRKADSLEKYYLLIHPKQVEYDKRKEREERQ